MFIVCLYEDIYIWCLTQLSINTPPNAGFLCYHHHFQDRKTKERHLAMLNHKRVQIVKDKYTQARPASATLDPG